MTPAPDTLYRSRRTGRVYRFEQMDGVRVAVVAVPAERDRLEVGDWIPWPDVQGFTELEQVQ